MSFAAGLWVGVCLFLGCVGLFRMFSGVGLWSGLCLVGDFVLRVLRVVLLVWVAVAFLCGVLFERCFLMLCWWLGVLCFDFDDCFNSVVVGLFVLL